ncbi:DDB1- and CUL4-associated factor 6, partial [Podila epigama]
MSEKVTHARQPSGSRSNVVRRFSDMRTSPAARHSHLQHQVLASTGFVKRLEHQPPLTGHLGCVNTISWDQTGEYLVTGSDDRYLNIYRPLDTEPLVHRIRSGHRQNIFSAKFMTDSSARKIVSCSAEGTTIFTDVERFVATSQLDNWVPNPAFHCHSDTSYEVMPDLVDSHIFYDCADDGKINRCACEDSTCDRHTFININSSLRRPSSHGVSFNGRIVHSFHRHYTIGISAITQRPDLPYYIAAACGDDTVRIYDSRKVDHRNHRNAQVYSFSPYIPHGTMREGDAVRGASLERRSLETRITSLKYDPNRSGQLLASYSRGDCYLIHPTELFTMNEELDQTQQRHGQSHEGLSTTDATRTGATNAVNESATSSSSSTRSPTAQSHIDTKGKRRRASSDSQDDPSIASETKKHAKPESKVAPTNQSEDSSQETQDMTDTTDTKSKANAQSKAVHVHFDDKSLLARVGHSDDEASGDSAQTAGPSGQTVEASRSGVNARGSTHSEEESLNTQRSHESESGEESDMPRLETAIAHIDEDEDDSMAGWDTSDMESETDQEEISYHDILRSALRSSTTDDETEEAQGSSTSSRAAKAEDRTDYWIKEANFFGPNSEFIMSGSDGGQIFFWDKHSGKIVNVIRADRSVVNCIQGHPVASFMLAASGIDRTTKILLPTAQEPIKVSSIRGVKRSTPSKYVVSPPAKNEEANAGPINPDDELDPEHAYGPPPAPSDDDDDDDDEDIEYHHIHGDIVVRVRSNGPAAVIMQLLQSISRHRRNREVSITGHD